MRLVIAVGGNALLARGEPPLARIQAGNVAVAVAALAPLAHEHVLLVTHGNGPQVGLLANESLVDPALSTPYPLDVLGAETQGMIGYLLLQAFENALPGRAVVSLICQTRVDADDPAFRDPVKFIGPQYGEAEALRLERDRGWVVRKDGTLWRRVVASPQPLEVVEMASIRTLLSEEVLVICSGGGGIPVAKDATGQLIGVEAVIDKDATAALLAEALDADALIILTDVDNVETNYGGEGSLPIGHTIASAMRSRDFPAGSMGPKVAAACSFVEHTGRPAMIGSFTEVAGLIDGSKGTVIHPDPGRPGATHGSAVAS